MPLARNKFSDAGMRYVKNVFVTEDNWLFGQEI